MGLGLPLMQLLTVSQFRAVIAHEFGHFYGGDTALGPWIYKTRAAIVRTVQQLAAANSYVVFLFNAYATMFMRVTLAVSRPQEYAADRLGAQIAGAKAMMEGLKQVHAGGAAWGAYLQTEVTPVLRAGFSPPLANGFSSFLNAPTMRNAVAEELQKGLASSKAEMYDSHPALAERISALQSLPEGEAGDGRLATELVDNLFHADTSLFLFDPGVTLKPLDWSQALDQVYIKGWNEQVEFQSDALRGLTFLALGKDLYSGELRNRLKSPPGFLPSTEQRDQMANSLAAAAFSLMLLNDGWTAHANLGEPILFKKEGLTLDPLAMVREISRGGLKHEAWEQRCEELGRGHLPVPTGNAQHSTVSA